MMPAVLRAVPSLYLPLGGYSLASRQPLLSSRRPVGPVNKLRVARDDMERRMRSGCGGESAGPDAGWPPLRFQRERRRLCRPNVVVLQDTPRLPEGEATLTAAPVGGLDDKNRRLRTYW